MGTIVAVKGGPGYASTNLELGEVGIGRSSGRCCVGGDLVLIDQRGTGHSQAVDSPQLQRGMVPEVVATTDCANQLGARYQGSPSAESAADIEAVRTALGLGPITLYGDSYGTLLAQAYSVRYPSSLRSLVLSSAYPANDAFWRTIYPAAMQALKLSCARNSACRARAELCVAPRNCAAHGTASSVSVTRSPGSSAPAARSTARSPTCSRRGPGRRTHTSR